MFNAPADAIDRTAARLASEYPTILAAVCLERGVDYDATDYPMALQSSRATVSHEDMESYTFPFSWIEAIPDGKVDEVTSGNVRSFVTLTLFVADRHPDGDVLASRLQCHLVALMRTFLLWSGPGYEGRATDWTGTPPYAPADLWVGSAGVQIEMQVIEARD